MPESQKLTDNESDLTLFALAVIFYNKHQRSIDAALKPLIKRVKRDLSDEVKLSELVEEAIARGCRSCLSAAQSQERADILNRNSNANPVSRQKRHSQDTSTLSQQSSTSTQLPEKMPSERLKPNLSLLKTGRRNLEDLMKIPLEDGKDLGDARREDLIKAENRYLRPSYTMLEDGYWYRYLRVGLLRDTQTVRQRYTNEEVHKLRQKAIRYVQNLRDEESENIK